MIMLCQPFKNRIHDKNESHSHHTNDEKMQFFICKIVFIRIIQTKNVTVNLRNPFHNPVQQLFHNYLLLLVFGIRLLRISATCKSAY